MGNEPVSTSPLYATDETVCIRARGDYINLSAGIEQLAYGVDGVITTGSPWTLTSATVDFMAQGVAPNNVAELRVPGTKGGGARLVAIDTVSPFTITFRVINKKPGVGQPVAPNGATSITFTINTFESVIEDVTWKLKNLLSIDEMIPFHGSAWQYVGVEDPFRDERAACVLGVMIQVLGQEARGKDGDWWNKFNAMKAERTEVIERLQIRWGPSGNSQPPSQPAFGMKLAR